MVKFVEQLKSENIFARSVAGGDFPYHSHYMNSVAPQLLEALNLIIPVPKERSNKWVSTSVPQEQWNEKIAKYASGLCLSINKFIKLCFINNV
jgi:fatty acid synthase, animal type